MKSKTASSQVTVVVVEDHPPFREHMTQALEAAGQFELIGVCNDLPAGLALLEMRRPDVLLVDLGLPSGSGMALVRAAQRHWGAGCCSAILTVTGNEEHLVTAVGAGAKGYVFKSDQPAQWLQTVQGLTQGLSPLHPELAERLLQKLAGGGDTGATPSRILLTRVASGQTLGEAAAALDMTVQAAGELIRKVYDGLVLPVPDLSRRELELISLLNKGYAFRMCAALMGVSESTTKTHATRAYQKLGANNLQMALYEARTAGLIP